MKGKLLFVAGAAVGYVLGARAGRKRYEQIAAAASKVWNAPPVQRGVKQAQDFALDRVSELPAALLDGTKKAFAQVLTGRPGETSAPARRTTPPKAPIKPSASTSRAGSSSPAGATKTTAAKPAASKPAPKTTGAKASSTKASTAKKPAAASDTGSATTGETSDN
ncbi:hypothetical protein [Compostimonas suwonensis]|uniref:Uncharacterized protein n=1 Tax=Compostimonas suwonensis TaxID=1048394 RepID=A0A2M9C3Z3_9MICO|nr:hypothetical protein [Compostimonas suwonensis]PJJ65238.1 hypothetical protein CLV54_0267 [Compostimonas suwonensis]